jgi:phosphate transport system substrate-binding protein
VKQFVLKAALASAVAFGAAAAQNVDITGAGATFPAPLITAMADEYREETGGRVTINYQSIGSGGGIQQFLEQTVMFGATERFLTDEQLAEVEEATGGTAFNMPVTLGDVVPTYNLPGIETGVVFTGEVLADLFLGNIVVWNDPALQELNPDIELPFLPVSIVHRSDGSGTTAIWTDYLSKVSEEWAERVGFGTSVNWPLGIGGNGNEGVAGVVQNTPGALGYNSLVYATLNDISYGFVVNSSGNIIEPSLAATTAAADTEIAPDTRVSLTNTDNPDGYPIAGFAWLLVYENLDQNNAISNREQAEELVRFSYWVLTEGQELAEPLDFAPLPESVVDLALDMVRQMKWQGEPIGEQIVAELEQAG